MQLRMIQMEYASARSLSPTALEDLQAEKRIEVIQAREAETELCQLEKEYVDSIWFLFVLALGLSSSLWLQN